MRNNFKFYCGGGGEGRGPANNEKSQKKDKKIIKVNNILKLIA